MFTPTGKLLNQPSCSIVSNLLVAGVIKQCCENGCPRFTLEIVQGEQKAALVLKG